MDHRKTALFREVNDSMTELLLQFEAEEEASFFCECPLRDCSRRVPLTRSEYEGIRRTGGFLVSPDCRRWPRVMLRTTRYVVVKDFRARLVPVREGAGSELSPSGPAADPGSSPAAAPDSMAAA
jgi:hypothetical protein